MTNSLSSVQYASPQRKSRSNICELVMVHLLFTIDCHNLDFGFGHNAFSSFFLFLYSPSKYT